MLLLNQSNKFPLGYVNSKLEVLVLLASPVVFKPSDHPTLLKSNISCYISQLVREL